MSRRPIAIRVLPERVNIVVPGESRLFRKTPPDTTHTFSWSEVTQVFVFKRDIFTVDLICMAFELNGAETLEVNEEMVGWPALVEAVPIHLAGAEPHEEWFQKVAFPAFKLCWTRIYPRDSESQEHTVPAEQSH